MKIIAEIGWNHMGDMGLAEDMIISAGDSGASIVKFQYWDPKLLKNGPWDHDGRREIYNKAFLDAEKINHLIEVTENKGLNFLISVFGTKGATLMKDLGQTEIKIPSHEVANLRLLEYCASNYEYVYFSAGAATKEEVLKAVEILKEGTCDFNLMHCVSSYPCNETRINLQRINWLRTLNNSVGLSDHTQSSLVPALAVSYGVDVIEKHFTTDNSLPGRDNEFALASESFSLMVKNINEAIQANLEHGLDYQDIESDTVENYRGRWEEHDYEF